MVTLEDGVADCRWNETKSLSGCFCFDISILYTIVFFLFLSVIVHDDDVVSDTP